MPEVSAVARERAVRVAPAGGSVAAVSAMSCSKRCHCTSFCSVSSVERSSCAVAGREGGGGGGREGVREGGRKGGREEAADGGSQGVSEVWARIGGNTRDKVLKEVVFCGLKEVVSGA